MGRKDPRIDAYIANAQPFARPILKHLRKLVHQGCPDVVETLKWSHPAFEHHGILAGMASFKEHCGFGFWKQTLLKDGTPAKGEPAMGGFGKLTSLGDLPADAKIVAMVKEAAKLNESGTKAPRIPKTAPKPAPRAPADLLAALAKNKKAKATFDAFTPSQKREYVEWIVEAKRPETRATRLTTAVEWMAEGKKRNWKYENC
jgi:uncharacterized protein YdeI (YjbR/CyaY-like superfamily)